MTFSLADLRLALPAYRPERRYAFQPLAVAAVILLLRERPGDGLDVLMLERARREGDPWSGHMAFPGGMQASRDFHALHTAWREMHEETGIDARQTRYLGALSERRTQRQRSGRRPVMRIRPHVFATRRDLPVQLNHESVDHIWLPLDFLADPANRSHLHWQWKGRSIRLPAYRYQGKLIWGLSLQMLDELVALLKAAESPRV